MSDPIPTAPIVEPNATPVPTPPPAPVEAPVETIDPKPTETVDFWKQKAREQEARAKSNAEKAQAHDAFVESQKTEAQRLADATAQAQRDAEEARAETTRYRVAATHGISSDYFDLLGSGNEEAITGRAERLAPLMSLATELEQLKAENEALKAGKPIPSPSRPVVALRPGATPVDSLTEGDQTYQALFGTD